MSDTVGISQYPISVYPPDSQKSEMRFELDKFMGTWYVIYSTLPLWKSRKDVTITYAPKPSTSSKLTQIDDIVRYRSNSASHDSKLSSVVGVDTLLTSPVEDKISSGITPASFKWRGSGWLVVASSHWQVLGCHCGGSDEDSSPEWALTYFDKTLFTPAGLDIYSRNAEGLPEALVRDIINKLEALGGTVGTLAGGFFPVERSPEAL